MNPKSVRISICVCTYRRPEMLARLLRTIQGLRTDDLFSFSVAVVDNDDQGSAGDVVARAMVASQVPITYDVEPERNISLARNRSVKNADGDLIAFIDDDEFPEDTWLLNHLETMRLREADGVLGPVRPQFDAHAPAWLVRSGLCERPRFKTGTVISDPRFTRTGNVLIRRSLFEGPDANFDPRFGRSGGGDAVFFKRLIQQGRRFVWCDEACVFEEVPPERQTRTYYLKRALTRGLSEAWETRVIGLGTLRSLSAIMVYTSALPFLLLFGQHVFMRYAVRDCDHIGKILGHLGIKVVSERPYLGSS